MVTYVSLGSLAGSLAVLGQPGGGPTPAQGAFFGVGLTAAVAVTEHVTRMARAALAKRT